MSIAGGSFEIIHEIEQKGFSYDDCLEYSIQYHHKQIGNWLLANYICEIISLHTCLNYCDFESYLFFLFNEIDVDECDSDETLLLHFCKQKISDVYEIKILIERGADVNKKFVDFRGCIDTPLSFLFKQKKPNVNKIKLLLNSGANINEIINISNYETGTILDYFCNKRKVNLNIIKFLFI